MGNNLPAPTLEQMAAISAIAQATEEHGGGGKVVSLTGPAGTGKTTVMKSLTECFSDVVVVTPTNRAASILRKKGVPATTVYAKFFCSEMHRDPKTNKRHLVSTPCYKMDLLPKGKRDFASVIIVDEASMLGSWIISQLQRMCSTLILVGDGSQLPPVNDRYHPRGLFCTRKHDAELKTVMRQAGQSPILELATLVRTCQTPTRLPADLSMFEPGLDFTTLMSLDAPQLVAFRNSTRRGANLRARKVLGYETPLPAAGDLLVCNTNWGDELLNGTQCRVVSFDWNGKDRFATATVALAGDDSSELRLDRFDMVLFLRDLPSGIAAPYLAEVAKGSQAGTDEDGGCSFSYGYCLTAHKAQGGEWPSVVVLDERSTAFWVAEKDYTGRSDQLEPNDFARRWFYTAITRAQDALYVVNPRWVNG